MRTGKSLLTAAEQALSAGETSRASKLFRQIRAFHPGTMESVAALCYLRSGRTRSQSCR